MSEMYFERENDICLSRAHSPVHFAHKKTEAEQNGYLLHLNNHIEIYIYISGDVDYIVHDSYIPLEWGDIVIILPHEVHVPVIKSRGAYERFYMLIPLDSFTDFPFEPLDFYNSVSGHKILLTPDAKKEFIQLLYKLGNTFCTEDSGGRQLQAAGLFLQAQGILASAKNTAPTAFEPKIRSEIPEHLREILKYIGLHAKDIHSIGALAKQFYISPEYLSTMFKKYVGINISHYLRIKKIAIAKALLEKGASVAEACYECGFSDSSHFIKHFKQYVGVTPKQYKNALRNNTAERQ